MTTKIITVEETPPAESTGADYYKGAPLNAAEFDQNLVNLRAAVDRKASLSNPTFTGTVVLPATTSIGDVSATELQYINSVTSNVQDQLNGKQATITTLATNKGGTGLTSFTSGGVVYASSTSALTTGSGLVFNGTALRVNSSSGIASYFQASGNGNTAGTTSFDFIQNSDNEGYIYQRANANIIFGTNNTERMRLDSSGNLAVGTTSGANTRIRIDYSGQSYGMRIGTTSTSGTAIQFVYEPSSQVGTITTTTTSTTYATSSDYRLKEDYHPVATPIDRLNELKPINFAWKVDGSRCDGFLAHELQEVIPEAATGTKDETRIEEYEVSPAVKDEEGNIITEAVMGEREVPVYQGIDQSKIVPLLTAALQEAVAKIESLTERIAALEAKGE